MLSFIIRKYNDYLEVLFEHRNKEYGAYILRKEYPAALNSGLFIAVMIVLIPVFIYAYTLWFPSGETMTYYPYIGQVQMYNDLISPEELKQLSRQQKPAIVENNAALVTADDQNPANQKKGPVIPDSLVSDSLSSSASRNGIVGDTTLPGSGDIYFSVEVMPQFPGGPVAMQRFISANVRYPAEAVKRGAAGTVKLTFHILKDGYVDKVFVLQSLDPMLDAEAVRVIRLMPRWKPAYHHGKPVEIICAIPITFNPTTGQPK
jgi:periplasmic protein TonB